MEAAAALRQAIAELGAVQAEMAAASTRDNGEWRRELVALRRRLQASIVVVSGAVGAFGGDEDARALRDSFSRMRSKVALHQANWPAVSIDREDEGYRQSVQEVRSASRDFIQFAGALIARHISNR